MPRSPTHHNIYVYLLMYMERGVSGIKNSLYYPVRGKRSLLISIYKARQKINAAGYSAHLKRPDREETRAKPDVHKKLR